VKKIITIGGGTGSYTVLRGLKMYGDIDLVAIVSMADDGGSTGMLRDELGVLPPGDVRQCLVALSEHTETVRSLINYRFEEGALAGHSFGNIFLAALEKVAGSFVRGVEVASDILKIKGKVVPVTEDRATLSFTLKDGTILLGENSINHADIQSVGVATYGFERPVGISVTARDAIIGADIIIIGPGNLYCSIIPNLIVTGFKEAVALSAAKIVLPINLTNKKGHSEKFSVKDYVLLVESFLEKKVDYVIYNSEVPSEEQVSKYSLQEGENVLVMNDMVDDSRIVLAKLLSHDAVNLSKADILQDERSFIRHDSTKLAEVLHGLFGALY
jgi:uncharacterized cofD-like protein